MVAGSSKDVRTLLRFTFCLLGPFRAHAGIVHYVLNKVAPVAISDLLTTEVVGRPSLYRSAAHESGHRGSFPQNLPFELSKR